MSFAYSVVFQISGGIVPGATSFTFTPADLGVSSFPQTIYNCGYTLYNGDIYLGSSTGNFVNGNFVSSNSPVYFEEGTSYGILITGPIEIFFTNITYNSVTVNWNYADYSTVLEFYDYNIHLLANLPLTTLGSYTIYGLTPNTNYSTYMDNQWGLASKESGKGGNNFTTLPLPSLKFGITWFFSP